MDKNNDIQVNKVDKWCAGVADVSLWQAKKSVDIFLCGYSSMLSIEALDAVRTIYVALDEALDRFNELEARHQKDTGMISEYEEENKNLKSELDIKTEEYTKLESEANKLRENNELCMKAHLRLLDESTKLATENEELRSKCETKEDALKKMIHEVAELEKEKIKLEDQLVQQKRLEVQARVNASNASTYKSEIKQVIELAKSYGLIIYDDRKDAISDDVVNIGMCGHYYVLDSDIKNEINRLKNNNDYLRDRCEELAFRSSKYTWAIKTILKKATYSPGHVAEELRFMARPSTTQKDVFERWEGIADELLGDHSKLVDKINRLEKKNEELSSQVSSLKEENDKLKDTLLSILKKLETKVGLCRVHLLDSYENRATLIMVEYDRLLIKYEKLKETNKSLRRTIRILDGEGYF